MTLVSGKVLKMESLYQSWHYGRVAQAAQGPWKHHYIITQTYPNITKAGVCVCHCSGNCSVKYGSEIPNKVRDTVYCRPFFDH